MSIGEAFGATGGVLVIPGVILTLFGAFAYSEGSNWKRPVLRIGVVCTVLAFICFITAIWSQVR